MCEHTGEWCDGIFPDDPDHPASCEVDGTCDDSCSPPARDDCTVAETVAPPPHVVDVAELPHTGAGGDVLLLVAAAMLAAGCDLACRLRRK